MAAKPPMPPGNLNLNVKNQQHTTNSNSNSNNKNSNTPNICEALNKHFANKLLNGHNQNHGDNDNEHELESTPSVTTTTTTAKAKQNCACTNISIMHLFHEMKQEFPTIPDAIVTQCVNENCHQRDNCIQMLKKELALHPIPVQTYPAKVLQQQQQHHHHHHQAAAKPPTPLKPTRVAPLSPALSVRPLINCINETKQQQPVAKNVPTANHNQTAGNDCSDAAAAAAAATAAAAAAAAAAADMTKPVEAMRARPTTLNLCSVMQQQQQRQVNAQLQQKIQQRQQQQQQQQHFKPLRKAPLPPLPPKPPHSNNHNGNSSSSVALAQQSSFSNDSSCLTSPLSSSESEISVNVSLSSPTSAAASTQQQQQQPSPMRHRSVITLQPEPPYARDFYSNAAAVSPTHSSSSSSPSARKSFTSLNLTLRQPHPTTGAAQSTIDITAGPAPSGTGSGITYSSSSFDARRGTHKNFQLTVTDEGSVFSAGCVRPPAQLYATCGPSTDNESRHTTDGPPEIASPHTFRQQQHHHHQQQQYHCQQMPEIFPYPTQAQNHIVASNYNSNHIHNSNSAENSPSVPQAPLYVDGNEEQDEQAHAAIIERQKTRRDKLANALRDNKKRLYELEQEINILTEPLPVGANERLDRDIKKLTEDCQKLLNDPNLNDSGHASNSMNRQNSAPAVVVATAQQPQPFPRQRVPSSLHLPLQTPNLDFVQHHSAPTSACITPQQQQQQVLQDPPPTYAQYNEYRQYLQQLQQQQQQQQATNPFALPRTPNAADEEEFLSESDVDDDEEPLDMWACNMCTFRNHPQLNMCEACENVRIKPGMIRILPSTGAGAAATSASANAVGIESDANLTAQLQQPYALPT